jgi:archaellum component FlaC
MSLESKVRQLESEMWGKASKHDLDRAESTIRQMKSDAEHERGERQSLEERLRQAVERIDALENAVSVECPGCTEAAGSGLPVNHMPPLCAITPKPEEPKS